MQLTDDSVREFSSAWEAEFGEALSIGEARERASLLLELYVLLARPLPREAQPPRVEGEKHDPA